MRKQCVLPATTRNLSNEDLRIPVPPGSGLDPPREIQREVGVIEVELREVSSMSPHVKRRRPYRPPCVRRTTRANSQDPIPESSDFLLIAYESSPNPSIPVAHHQTERSSRSGRLTSSSKHNPTRNRSLELLQPSPCFTILRIRPLAPGLSTEQACGSRIPICQNVYWDILDS